MIHMSTNSILGEQEDWHLAVRLADSSAQGDKRFPL